MSMFAVDAKLELSSEHGSAFTDGMFNGTPAYCGKYCLSIQFLNWDRVLTFDGKGEDGEEFKCTQALDSLGEVDYWISNAANHPICFCLTSAAGKIWPDSVVMIKGGPLLVVEYKGAHLVADALEKRTIGELWQRAREGKGLYIVEKKASGSMEFKQQSRAALP